MPHRLPLPGIGGEQCLQKGDWKGGDPSSVQTGRNVRLAASALGRRGHHQNFSCCWQGMVDCAENLHRSDLTALERSTQEARWIELAAKKQSDAAQVGPHRKAGQQPGGINAAVRELGIERTQAQRAVKAESLPTVGRVINGGEAKSHYGLPKWCRYALADTAPTVAGDATTGYHSGRFNGAKRRVRDQVEAKSISTRSGGKNRPLYCGHLASPELPPQRLKKHFGAVAIIRYYATNLELHNPSNDAEIGRKAVIDHRSRLRYVSHIPYRASTACGIFQRGEIA